MKVACVLHKSHEYDTDYASRFLEGLSKFAGNHEFLLITDGRWPGWWSKMSLFDPKISGDLLYFDLDTMIVGDLEDILAVDKLTVLRDFNYPNRVASGMMFIPEDERGYIWEDWIKDPQGHINSFPGVGDGGYLAQFWEGAARWQDLVPNQIVSYKNSCLEAVPEDARVVCFHGRPRPRDVKWMLKWKN